MLGCTLLVAAVLALGLAGVAQAMPVQFFYVPFPEDQLLTGFDAINAAAVNPITSYITISAVADGTVIYWDQWENGYDIDISNTLNVYSASNLGGTQIWGDGNTANGAPPGVPSDLIDSGTVIQIDNDVDTTTRQSVIDFDGGDKIAATKTVAVTRSSWAAVSLTLFAGCVEVFDTNDWGTDYRMPVGTDIPNGTDYQMFEYAALSIMAGENGSTVWADANADGDYLDANDLNGVGLGQGESTMITNVSAGARVVSTQPVQVDMFTGDVGSNYESRDSALIPTNMWATRYYTPTSTPNIAGNGDERTTVWLYNPGASALNVTYQRRSNTGTLSYNTLAVPAGSYSKQILENATNGTGSQFYSSVTSSIAVDASTSGTVQNGNSLTIAHTTGAGTNRLMLVGVTIYNDANGTNDVQGITYGPAGAGQQTLSYVGKVIAPTGGGGNPNSRPQTEIWALANPTSGNRNVVITLTGARTFAAGVTTFSGVNVSSGLASALGTYASASASSGTAQNVTVNTAGGQMVYDVVAAGHYGGGGTDPSNFTVGDTNQTIRMNNVLIRSGNNNQTVRRLRSASSTRPVPYSGSTTMSWTSTTNDPWAQGAVPINPATTTEAGSFYAFSTTDSASATYTNNQAWDWGFTMIPQTMLTTEALVGLGIGRDPDSAVNPNENGNPVWVTPVGNGNNYVTVYVDYDADPTTGPLVDPSGYHYDTSFSLRELEQTRIYNPSGNQSVMLVYTLDQNVKLAVAWGQDPQTASASAPGLDVGTSVPPMPEFTAGKDGLLYDDPSTPGVIDGDHDGDGYITCGDEIVWPINVQNVSRIPVPDLIVSDAIPADTTYVPNSTYVGATQIPDGTSGTPYPLDEGGYNYGVLAPLASFTVTFRVTIDSYPNLTPGTLAIYNNGVAHALNWDDPVDDRVFLRARVSDYVWWDEDGDGIQGPTEGGIAGVAVTLLDGSGNVVYTDQGVPITTVTDDTGLYDFTGLLPGSYILEFIPPDGTELTLQGQGGDSGLDSNPDPATDRTGVITLGGGEHNPTVDAGIIVLNPTRAVVGSFSGNVHDGKVVVNWQTLSEIGTAGYFLERREGSGWMRINSALVPALVESPSGASYSVVDPTAQPGETYSYRLVEVEARGTIRHYGPYQVTPADPMPAGRAADIVASGEQSARIPKTPKRLAMWSPDATSVVVSAASSTPDRLRVEVVKPGLYRIDAADLVSGLGLSDTHAMDLIRTKGVKLTNRGKTVSYLPAADGSALYFYGEGIDSIYTASNVYWLTLARGTVMTTRKGSSSSASPVTSFTDTVHFEQDLLDTPAIFHDPEADFWFWDYLVAGDDSPDHLDVKDLSLDAPGVVAGLTLQVGLQGLTTVWVANEHHVQVSLNGTPLGEASWSGITSHLASFAIPADVLVPGSNEVEIKALLDGGVDYSLVGIDSLDLTYERSTDAVDDQLRLVAQATAPIQVAALSTTDAWVFDVTNPAVPVSIQPKSTGGDPGSAWLMFVGSAGKKYVVSTAQAALHPFAISAVSASTLATGASSADYVVITTDALYDAASQLAAYRAGQGLKTKVVTMAQIYDAFNYGIASPHAIQSFVAYATTRWLIAPRYVVLVGEGSYDYKNFAGHGDSMVPTLMTDTETGLAASDVVLADVKGADGVPEVALGRIPAATEEDLDTVLAKIQAYETAGPGEWQQSVLFTADNGDEGGSFPANSDSIAAKLPRTLHVSKAYLEDLDLDAARSALFGGFSGSTLLIHYGGHAGVGQLADEGLLTTDDLSTLPFASALPILAGFTCLAGDFSLPGYDGLGEGLIKQPAAGAIAVYAPTAMEDNEDSVRFAGFFMSNLFGSSRTVNLGRVVQASLKAAAGSVPVELLRTYNLLGDPALKVKW